MHYSFSKFKSKLICKPCGIRTQVKLPPFRNALLTALQNSKGAGVFTSFDLDTETCVVDNCANVNIWNDINGFIPESYLKINEEASTAVSAVNGEGNLPAVCGDVPIEWTDDKGQNYKTILKNVLHFPKSPVKILSVVSLVEQFQVGFDTWILSRIFQFIFT